MIDRAEFASLVSLLEALHVKLEGFEMRLQGFEEALIEGDDKLETIATAMTSLEAVVSTLSEISVPRAEFEHYLATNHEKFQHLGALMAEITGMRVQDAVIPTRFGERVAKIEDAQRAFQSQHLEILSQIADGLVEVQGQIANPFARRSALQALRDEVLARRRTTRL
ncbi:hypothetical protein ACSD7O_00650 [Methylorubrum extorquens]|uniref:hypothetical protein n=1 Tax=Methylorubrum extorquens TaxID=408 RepID=UPI003F607F46